MKSAIKSKDKIAHSQSKKKEYYSAHNRTLKIFLGSLLIPLVLTTVTSLYVITKTRQRNIAELQNLSIENTREKIGDFLNAQMKDLELIVDERRDGSPLDIPTKLEEVSPDALLTLFNIKRNKGAESAVKRLEFISTDGSILVKAEGDSPADIYEYFPADTKLLTFKDDEYRMHGRPASIDPADKAFTSALDGIDYIYPAGPIKGVTDISVASRIKNQAGETIGVFKAVVGAKRYFENVVILVNSLKTQKLDQALDRLFDVSSDGLLNITNNIRQSIDVATTLNGNDLYGLSKDIYLLNKDLEILLKYQSDDGGMLLINPSRPPSALTKNISITSQLDYSLGSFNEGMLSDAKVFLSPFECRHCQDELCRNCEKDKYILRAIYPINDVNDRTVGYYAVEIDTQQLGEYLRTVTLSDSLDTLAQLDPDRLYEYLKNSFQSSENAVDILLIDKSGETLGRYNTNSTKAFPIEIKDDYWHEYSPNSNLSYHDLTRSKKIVDNLAGSTSFRSALWGEDYYNPVDLNKDVPTIKLLSRIRNSDNEGIGVIEAEVKLIPIYAMLENMKTLGKTDYIYIVDEDGFLLASQEPALSEYAQKTGRKLNDIQIINNIISGTVYDGLVNYASYMNPLGKDVVLAARPLRSSQNESMVNWYIVSEWPKDDAYDVIADSRRLSIAVALFSFSLMLALGLLLTIRFTKPDDSKHQATKKVKR